MGYSQYLCRTLVGQQKYKKLLELEKRYNKTQPLLDEDFDICYLTNYRRLQNFMRDLYLSKVDKQNIEYKEYAGYNERVYLNLSDLKRLEKAVKNSFFGDYYKDNILNNRKHKNNMISLYLDDNQKTSIFISQTLNEDYNSYINFIETGKIALEDGYYIFYICC